MIGATEIKIKLIIIMNTNKNVRIIMQAVKSSFQKKILPTLKCSTAEVEVGLCILSLVLTCMSTLMAKIGYGCIAFDTLMLVRALVQGQLWKWQSAISMLSIGLTVAGLLTTGSVALAFGFASVILDVTILIFAYSNYTKSGNRVNSELIVGKGFLSKMSEPYTQK